MLKKINYNVSGGLWILPPSRVSLHSDYHDMVTGIYKKGVGGIHRPGCLPRG